MVIKQQEYIKEILYAYSGQHNCITTTHLTPKLHLFPLMEEPLSDLTLYRQLIGKLNFHLHTRPILAYSV